MAVSVEMLMGKKKKHGGMDSDPFLDRIPSPSSHSQHHIYSLLRLPAEGAIDTNEMERTGRAEMVQRGRLVGVFPQGPPQVDPRLQRPWIYLRSPTSREIGCSRPFQVLRPSPHELWCAQHGVVGSVIIRSGIMVVSEH